MAKESDKVRLPELPVFKKYSLALRQEFASVDEILAVLERTSTKIRDSLERAEEERRRQETSQTVEAEEIEGSVEVDSELGSASSEEVEDLDGERPFWEEPGVETTIATTETDARRDPIPRRPRSRAKPKKKAKPVIIRVGDQGRPIRTPKGSSKETAATKSKKVAGKTVGKRSHPDRSNATSPRAKSKAKGAVGPKTRPRSRTNSRKR